MSTDLFRNYMDFIAEASEPEQLNEGVIDWIGEKIKGLVDRFISSSPRAKAAYDAGKKHKDELINILKTSKDSKEVKAKVQALVKQDQESGALAEGFANHPGQTIGAGLAILGSSAYLLVDKLLGVMDQIMAIPTSNPTMATSMLADERLPYLVVNYGFPLMLLIYGLTMLFYIGTSDDR